MAEWIEAGLYFSPVEQIILVTEVICMPGLNLVSIPSKKRDSSIVRQIDVDEDYLKKYLVDKVGNANFEDNIPLELLIQHDESEKLEFKSSMLWSYIECCCKKTLVHDIVRSICQFFKF